MAEVGFAAGPPPVPRRERYGTLWGSLAVFAFIFVWMGFWITWDSSVSGSEEIAPGTTVQVSPAVSFVPADGWELSKANTRPGSQAVVTRQSGAFVVEAAPWMETLPPKVAEEQRLLKAGAGVGLFGDQQSFHTGNGLTGVKFFYTGAKSEGVVWMTLDAPGRTVVVIRAESAPGTLQQNIAQLQQMVDSVKIGAAS